MNRFHCPYPDCPTEGPCSWCDRFKDPPTISELVGEELDRLAELARVRLQIGCMQQREAELVSIPGRLFVDDV